MNILILKPGNDRLDFSFYESVPGFPILEGTRQGKDGRLFKKHLENILGRCRDRNNQKPPDAFAIYGIYGGESFKKPEIASLDSFDKLKELIPLSPLQIPGILALMEALTERAPEIPQILLFGSSFFVDLPVRETLYGLNPDILHKKKARRFGYHGLYHEAACRAVLSKMKNRGNAKNPRIISISLNPIPELAAVSGLKPLMVTSGLTPLEGLPGRQTCGEIDPAIVFLLAKKKNWGPEKINEILTRESGLFALADHTATLDRVLDSGEEKYRLARSVLLYRILLACGAAVAVLGGVDAFVFSGQCVRCGMTLSEEILSTNFFNGLNQKQKLKIEFLEDSLDSVIAEKTGVALLHERMRAAAGAC